MIILDVGGVGRRAGPPTLELCRQIRLRFPQIELVSGGGVRDVADLARLRQAGCDAALVSTWLHMGSADRPAGGRA
jgi:phosphoribosylformimino-5-aminoimidazole carboxamide ribotide isomerase